MCLAPTFYLWLDKDLWLQSSRPASAHQDASFGLLEENSENITSVYRIFLYTYN